MPRLNCSAGSIIPGTPASKQPKSAGVPGRGGLQLEPPEQSQHRQAAEHIAQRDRRTLRARSGPAENREKQGKRKQAGGNVDYGTFPRKIREYVFNRKILTLPAAIRASSALTAETFGLADRGKIREGFFADIVVFDETTIADRATYLEPTILPTDSRHRERCGCGDRRLGVAALQAGERDSNLASPRKICPLTELTAGLRAHHGASSGIRSRPLRR